jgi:hypothetical protein
MHLSLPTKPFKSKTTVENTLSTFLSTLQSPPPFKPNSSTLQKLQSFCLLITSQTITNCMKNTKTFTREQTVSKISQQILTNISSLTLVCLLVLLRRLFSSSVFMVQRDVLNNSTKDKSVQERGYETLKGRNKSFYNFFFSFSLLFSFSMVCNFFSLFCQLVSMKGHYVKIKSVRG